LSRVLDGFADDSDGPQIHPKKDIIDQLSGAIQVVTDVAKEDAENPQIPLMAMVIGLKDGAQVKKTLAKAAKSDGFPGRTREFEGQTVYEFPANESTFSVAVTGNSLLMASDTALLETAIRGKTAKPLAASDSYKALTKLFPKKTSFVSFQRSEGQVKMLYDTLRNRDNDDVEGIDLKKLPEWSAIAKYFQPQGSYAIPDKKGALFVGFALGTDE